MAFKRIVFFRIGDLVYGLDVFYTQGIEKPRNLMPVPNALSHIKGLINLRGEIIPVYSLRKKFGMAEIDVTSSTELIVTKLKNGILIAFEVDGVREITEISDETESIPPALVMSGETEYIEKVVQLKDTLAILLNPEGVLTPQEKYNIEMYLEKLKEEKEKQKEKQEKVQEGTEA